MSLLIAMMMLSPDAQSKEPPERPARSEEVASQCPEAIPIREGMTAVCRGILIPTSWVADYELTEAHADRLEKLYRIDTTDLQLQLDLTRKLLEHERKPVPIMDRKTTWAGIGAIIGSAAVIGGGYVMLASAGGNI